MKIINKLYLSIGLLVSIESSMMATITIENCDDLLHNVLTEQLFKENDSTSFVTIIDQIIEILEVKMTIMSDEQQKKCKDIIVLLQNNKDEKALLAWKGILTNILTFENLLPKNTKSWIDNIPWISRVQILIKKLNGTK